MTLYAIYDPRPGQAGLPAAVPEGFSPLAALLPPVFFGFYRLWLALAVWLFALGVLIAVSGLLGAAATLALYGLSALWLGFAAPGLRRHGLQRRGWTHRGTMVAASHDMAQLEALA